MKFINLSISNLFNINIFIYIVSRLFQTKIDKKYIYIIYGLEFICLCIVNSIQYTSINAIIVILTNTVLLFMCYRGSFMLKIYITFVYAFFGIIFEMLSLIFIHYLFQIGYNQITVDSIYYLLGTICSSVFLLIIMKMFSKILTSLSNTKYPKKTILLLFLPITSVLFVISIKDIDNVLVNNNVILFLIFMGLLISNILSFYLFFDIIVILNENNEIKLKESYRKIDELNYQLLENKYDSTRMFIHDIKKHINIITSLVELNDYKELKLYIKELKNEIEKINYTIQTNQKILNLVINQYINLFEKESIKIKLDIDDLNLSFLNIYEQSIIYGNLIENAIDSCVKCNAPRNIILKLKSDKNHIIIKQINTCSNANIVDGLPKTSKNDKNIHGLGLKKVKNIVDSHNGKIIFNYNDKLNTFYTSIILPKEV